MSNFKSKNEITLLYAGESLLTQIAEWVRRRPGCKLRLASCQSPSAIREAVSASNVAVIDATEHPGPAMSALPHAVAGLGRDAVAIYTEMTYEGLELFVRVRGVVFLLGPMSPDEWESFLASPVLRAAASRAAWEGLAAGCLRTGREKTSGDREPPNSTRTIRCAKRNTA